MIRLACLFLVIGGLTSVPLTATPFYTATYLGSFTPTGLNNSGQAVGYTYTGAPHAVLYSNGTMQDLGPGHAYAISNNGLVVGLAPTSTSFVPFVYSNGSMQTLGSIGYFQPYSVNDTGEIAGETYLGYYGGPNHAALYANGTLQDLGTLAGSSFSYYSAAYGINDSGEVVGWADTTSALHAFLYSNGVMQDLGTLAGGSSLAYAINNSGEIVGYSTDPKGGEDLFLYNNSAMQNLGNIISLGSGALNDGGQIVGSMELPNTFQVTHAFLYSGGALYDLNSLVNSSLGLTLSSAVGINDDGQILVSGKSRSGYGGAFLLTPTPVPEPGAGTLCVSGGLLLAGIAGWRRIKVNA